MPQEIEKERIREMEGERPRRISYEIIEKVAIERYEELKEVAWEYFLETITAEYWSALIENFDLFI